MLLLASSADCLSHTRFCILPIEIRSLPRSSTKLIFELSSSITRHMTFAFFYLDLLQSTTKTVLNTLPTSTTNSATTTPLVSKQTPTTGMETTTRLKTTTDHYSFTFPTVLTTQTSKRSAMSQQPMKLTRTTKRNTSPTKCSRRLMSSITEHRSSQRTLPS